MPRLSDFLDYIDGRIATVHDIWSALNELQSKYESFYAEVREAREREIEQLCGLVGTDRAGLPAALVADLEQARGEVERKLDEQLAQLESASTTLATEAEELRRKSSAAEKSVHAKNVDLDKKEEALKGLSARLLKRIEEYNGRIRELGTGFGFFRNFLSMRRLQAERVVLDEEQAGLAAQIEKLRSTWASREADHVESEGHRAAKWVELRSSVAGLRTKLDHLRETRSQVVLRSAVERAIEKRWPPSARAAADDPPCQRCKSRNPRSNHFCCICAARLGTDRPDAAGSLAEVAELNLHHKRFADGMRACQQIVALTGGILSGLRAFRKSIEGMVDSERRYPLPKLQIEVPAASVKYGRNFDVFLQTVKRDLSLHPLEFAQQVEKCLADAYTEEKIRGYFERMGEELSRQADGQWKQ